MPLALLSEGFLRTGEDFGDGWPLLSNSFQCLQDWKELDNFAAVFY